MSLQPYACDSLMARAFASTWPLPQHPRAILCSCRVSWTYAYHHKYRFFVPENYVEHSNAAFALRCTCATAIVQVQTCMWTQLLLCTSRWISWLRKLCSQSEFHVFAKRPNLLCHSPVYSKMRSLSIDVHAVRAYSISNRLLSLWLFICV